MNSKSYFVFFILAAILLFQDVVPLFFIERNFYIFNTMIPGNVFASFILFSQIVLSLLMILLFKKRSLLFINIILLANFIMMLYMYLKTRDINIIPIIGIVLSAFLTVGLVAFFHHRASEINHSLIELAHTDYLTEANNLRCLENDLDRLVKNKAKFALMIIDLDSFKHINEVRGYKCGNEVLKTLVSRWKKNMGSANYIYRINADEFALIYKDYSSPEELKKWIERVGSVFETPVLSSKYENYICACGGVAEHPENSSLVEELRQYADAALSDAKKKIKGKEKFCYCTFNADTLHKVKRYMYVCDVLQKAVEFNLLYLMFHPQYDAKTKKLQGFECLLRLHDFDGNEIGPEEFIPIAEKQGFIFDVGQWVMENGLKAFKAALDKASPDKKNVTVSINISCIQFLDESFIELCKKIVLDSKINIKNIILELTESVLVNSTEKAINLIKKLNEWGINVSMDDFGTGYSSLSYIYRFNFSELKIDKSFTDLLGNSAKNDVFIKAVIDTCHKFGIKVVTEGVENESQYNKLLDFNCDVIQGYYFSRPVDVNRMTQMMQE